jgi:5-hydroxyisourate hydrolase-like protein (transthyretin family)
VFRVFNIDNSSYVPAGVNGTFWVTSDGANYLSNSTQSNSSGYLTVNFKPTCDYYVGIQKWNAGVVGDACYKPVNLTSEPTNLNLTVYGTLSNSITNPQDFYILKGNNLTLAGTLTDDCGLDIANATVKLTPIHNLTNSRYYCSPVTNQIGGNYQCILNTSDLLYQWYNLEMNASQQYYHSNNSFRLNSSFFIETTPLFSSPAVLKSLGGWGESFPFSVVVTDDDADSVRINLYSKKDTEADWTIYNLTDVAYPQNTLVNLSIPAIWFSCADIGSWQTFFESVDDRGYSSNSTILNFSREANDVVVTYAYGDGNTVMRNGSQTTTLSLLATDTDKNESLGLGNNATVWVTTDTVNYDSGMVLGTNSSGYINLDFDPSCAYLASTQKWKGGTRSNVCYKDYNSSNSSVNVNAPLYPYIEYPSGQGFLRGVTIPINATLRDECSLVSGATPSFSLKTASSGTTFTCTNIVQGSGAYNCSWSSALRPMGFYNVTFSASKSYYISNSTTKVDALFVGSSPMLSNDRVSPTSEGWGALYTFHSDVFDQDQNWNILSLYKSLDGVNYALIASRNITTTGGQNLTTDFPLRFTCGDMGTNYFYFTTTDQFGFNSSTAPKTFTTDQDDITVTLQSNSNSTVRRISANTAYLNVRVFDSDYNAYPDDADINFWVTRNGSYYDTNYSCVTSNGYCEAYHDPACTTSAGVQNWFVQAIDSCYKPVNSTSRQLAVYGQLTNNIIPNFANQIALRNRNFTFASQVSDECLVNINDASIYWYNETTKLLATNYAVNWTVPKFYKQGLTTIQTNATKQYFDNGTNSSPIIVHGWSNLSSLSPANGTQIIAGSIIDVVCTVRDNDTNANITNYPVRFYKDGILQDEINTINGTSQWPWVTSTEIAGPHNLSCVIVDNPDLYYNVSAGSINVTVSIARQLVIWDLIPDLTTIYRNNSFTPNYVNITVRVRDANIQWADGALVKLFNSTFVQVNNCTTNANGYCNLIYDAPENMIPGTYSLYMNASKNTSQDSILNTTSVTVYGKLVSTITTPLNGTFYSKVDIADIAVSVLDENSNPISLIVGWYNESGLMVSTVSNALPTPFSLVSQSTGYRNFSIQTSKAFYDPSSDGVIIRISGLADVDVYSPLNDSLQVFPDNLTVMCRVFDHDAGSNIANYSVRFSYDYSGGNATQNLTTNSSGYANFIFIPSIKGLVRFDCAIDNDESKFYSAFLNSSTVYITEKDMRPPQIHNTTILPNASLEANLNQTTITSIITDDSNVNNAYAVIALPNGSIENIPLVLVANYTYSLNYTPKFDGIYNVTIYAIDDPPESNLNSSFAGYFQVFGKTNGSIYIAPIQVTAFGITQTSGYSFAVTLNFTNTGQTPMYATNISRYDNSNSEITYNDTGISCGAGGTLFPNQSCYWNLLVNVLPKTPQKVIRVTLNSSWRNPDLTVNGMENSTLIVVAANPQIDIINPPIFVTSANGFNGVVANITTAATGNERLLGVRITTLGGDIAIACPSCIVTFIPSFQGLLNAGANFTSNVSISIPASQPPGSFWTFIQANGSSLIDTVLINFTIPNNGSWTALPSSFGNITVAQNTSGIIGNITLTNNGNVKSTYLFSAPSAYLLFDNQPVLAIDLDKQVTRNITLGFGDATNPGSPIPPATPSSYYPISISVTSSNGTPSEQFVFVGLNITDQPPLISNVTSNPSSFEAIYGNTTISALITDNFAVSSAWANVTNNAISDIIPMVQNGNSFSVIYSSSIPGAAIFAVCAIDDAGYSTCSAEYNLTIAAQTNLSYFAPSISISNVTLTSGANTSVNISFINLGYARALNSTYRLNLPVNLSASPSNLTLGTIYLGTN